MDPNELPQYSVGQDLKMIGLSILFVVGCLVVLILLLFVVQPFFNGLGNLSGLGSLHNTSVYVPIDRGNFNSVF